MRSTGTISQYSPGNTGRKTTAIRLTDTQEANDLPEYLEIQFEPRCINVSRNVLTTLPPMHSSSWHVAQPESGFFLPLHPTVSV